MRWAEDIGMQKYYDLEKAGLNLWDNAQTGDRWRVFRYTNFAHNTLTLDNSLHQAGGRVPLTDFSGLPALGVSADLAPVLGSGVSRAIRRFRPHHDARGLTISDELGGLRPGAKVTWTLVTRAEAALNGSSVQLSREGRSLNLRAVAPAGVVFETAPASGPAAHDAAAPEFRIVRFTTIAPASGELKIEAVFAR